MTEAKKISAKEMQPYIDELVEPVGKIRSIVEKMPECTKSKSFTTSLLAFEKKISGGSMVERIKLTDEEKEMLKKFREAKTEVQQVPPADDVRKKKKTH